jgi:DNA-binding response OmpR family regulator
MEKIIIIEDEARILMALEDNLKIEGYQVASALDGEEGLSMVLENKYDLIILDIMLPKINGFDVCRQIRQKGISTPILMLTAKSQEVDKVLGLELGADDYVTKPFSSRELLARVKALLRRARPREQEREVYEFGNLEIDFKKYEAKKKGNPVFLTALEFSLLLILIKHNGEVVSRDVILDEVWGGDVFVQPRTVDKHIAELRKKIEDDPSHPRHILGVRSIGYKFAE